MTLTLFAETAGDSPAATCRSVWERLSNADPIVSGLHPLHFYFGTLGAQALRERGTSCCYDPAFQAGYPKTPVFDSGSRPAELFLYLAGGGYHPAAYKIGLAVSCGLIPILLALAAWGAGLGRGATCLAIACGLAIFWGTPCHNALASGDLDLLLAGASAAAWAGLLVAFHERPHPGSWLGLLLIGCLGWFAHPFLWLLLLPLLLVYYLNSGPTHPFGWHAALGAALIGPLAINSVWLLDWLRSWWIRLPLHLGTISLRHRTFHTLWSAPLWGDVGDRALGMGLLALAATGIYVLIRQQRRPAAYVLGLGSAGFLALTVAGLAWPPLGQLGATQLLASALWLTLLPAVLIVEVGVRAAARRLGSWRVALLAGGLLGAGLALAPESARAWLQRWTHAAPLGIGLNPDRRALVETLKNHTGPEARILWEDRAPEGDSPRWTVLLPLLTERAYLGGLAPDGCIEHAFAGCLEQSLLGRPLTHWTDAELNDYCRRYNVGWIVCWSPACIERIRAWRGKEAELAVHDGMAGVLFRVPSHSFVLKGQARWLEADSRHITLADVIPDDGMVVLSLHYQSGLRVSPARIQVEREPDPLDPIPFIRLRVPGPTALITLTWEER